MKMYSSSYFIEKAYSLFQTGFVDVKENYQKQQNIIINQKIIYQLHFFQNQF